MKRLGNTMVMVVFMAIIVGMTVSCRHLNQTENDVAESKDVVIHLSDGISMRLKPIPAGAFVMGSPESEMGREDAETQHHVTLTKGFWLGETEVTQSQYEAVIGKNPSFEKLKNEMFPVHNVGWDDAMAFCHRLNERAKAAGRLPDGYEYSLPTEAEWEYACRAGRATAFHFEDGIDKKKANYKSYDELIDRREENETLKTVGSYKPNAWGLYDMHGNVLEWCYDRYDDYPESAVLDPQGPMTGWNRVLRGGSWIHDANYCRSACRISAGPSIRNDYIGFRVALVPLLKKQSKPDDILLQLPGGISMRLKGIPAGKFMMGSPQGEEWRDRDETQHLVTLTKNYWLGETEVTEAQYEAVMGENSSKNKLGSDYPAQNVCWDDAMKFCHKLTKIEKAAGRLPKGYEYSLPSEAQWEYACRAGTTTAYHFGDSIDKSLANYNYADNWKERNESKDTMKRVKSYKPNNWGLYDMHGNAWEWCRDWDYDYPDTPVTDPVGSEKNVCRALRGGCWISSGDGCRSAERGGSIPGDRSGSHGFRVALVPIQ